MWLPNPTPEGVLKFKKLYEDTYGEELPISDARDVATSVLLITLIKEAEAQEEAALATAE